MPNTSLWGRFRQSLVFQALTLGLFAMGGAALLAGGDLSTRDAIAQRQAEDLKASLTQVLPPESHDNDLLAEPLVLSFDEGPLTVYRGTRQGQVTGLAFAQIGRGYAGDIRLILGLNPDGRILGVRVLAHQETPGLGDRIERAKDDWILDFDGRSLDHPPDHDWKVKKDGGLFDQFSGATITPRAVVAAVHGGLTLFAQHREALLAIPEGDKP
ncbi:electron transport complex subunit RsxG [Magnetospira thiophila]